MATTKVPRHPALNIGMVHVQGTRVAIEHRHGWNFVNQLVGSMLFMVVFVESYGE